MYHLKENFSRKFFVSTNVLPDELIMEIGSYQTKSRAIVERKVLGCESMEHQTTFQATLSIQTECEYTYGSHD